MENLNWFVGELVGYTSFGVREPHRETDHWKKYSITKSLSI